MSGLIFRRLLLAAAVLLQLVAWHAVRSASIVTVYQLADCSDDNGGTDMGVEASYNGVQGAVNLVYHSMNLTGRSCLPLQLGIGSGTYGTALYDCQYDPYSGLSTIIVLNWGIFTDPAVAYNPTCNTSLAFNEQHLQWGQTGSWLQHSGFVNGQCTRLHEGSYGFINWPGYNNPVYARINCSMMIPNYEVVRQVPSLPVNPVQLRGMSRPPSSTSASSSSSSTSSSAVRTTSTTSVSSTLASSASSTPDFPSSSFAASASSSASSSTSATSVAAQQSSSAAATSSFFATSSQQAAATHAANSAAMSSSELSQAWLAAMLLLLFALSVA